MKTNWEKKARRARLMHKHELIDKKLKQKTTPSPYLDNWENDEWWEQGNHKTEPENPPTWEQLRQYAELVNPKKPEKDDCPF